MVPAWGSASDPIPVETQMLLTELPGGGHALLLPLIERNAFRASLRPPAPGQRTPRGVVLARVESGDESVKANTFSSVVYVAAGGDPFELIERGVAAAARISGTARPRGDKEAPASLDVFGWNTWWALLHCKQCYHLSIFA
jgi:raffinose synthase